MWPDVIVRAVKTLVCPHCQTNVPERASVCTGCGAEIVRGTTRRERAGIGCLFALGAIPVFALIFGVLQMRGAIPRPEAREPEALFFFLGTIAFFICAYWIGTRIARLFRRSKVRFFRTSRHQ